MKLQLNDLLIHEYEYARDNMASEAVVFQLSAGLALVGIAVGWRGLMTKYHAVYDQSTAWAQIFWGLVLGAITASLGHISLFLPYYEMVQFDGASPTGGVRILDLFIVVVLMGLASHFILRRERVREEHAHMTAGWAFGLAVGAMFAMVMTFMSLGFYRSWLNLQLIVSLLGYVLIIPRAEAIITCYQGYLMLNGRRWGAILRASVWRVLNLTILYYSFFDPLAWVFIGPTVFFFSQKADSWMWSMMTNDEKRTYRKNIKEEKLKAKQASLAQSQTISEDSVTSQEE